MDELGDANIRVVLSLDIYELVLLRAEKSCWIPLLQLSKAVKERLLNSGTLWRNMCYKHLDESQIFSFEEMQSLYNMTWFQLFKSIWTLGSWCFHYQDEIRMSWYEENKKWIRDIKFGRFDGIRIISVKRLDADVLNMPAELHAPGKMSSLEIGLGDRRYYVSERKVALCRSLGLTDDVLVSADNFLAKKFAAGGGMIADWIGCTHTAILSIEIQEISGALNLDIFPHLQLLSPLLEPIIGYESFQIMPCILKIVLVDCKLKQPLFRVPKRKMATKNQVGSSPDPEDCTPFHADERLDLEIHYEVCRGNFDHIKILSVNERYQTEKLTLRPKPSSSGFLF